MGDRVRIGDVVTIVDPESSSNGRFGTVAGRFPDGRLNVRFSGWTYASFWSDQLAIASSLSISTPKVPPAKPAIEEESK